MTKSPYRKGGPTPYVRLSYITKLDQGDAIWRAVALEGATFRQAGAALGLSKTTAWRRYWFVVDYGLPAMWGVKKPGPLPPQRGTKACPRGRPWQPHLDGPDGPFGRRP